MSTFEEKFPSLKDEPLSYMNVYDLCLDKQKVREAWLPIKKEIEDLCKYAFEEEDHNWVKIEEKVEGFEKELGL